jgi:hypothetical protein
MLFVLTIVYKKTAHNCGQFMVFPEYLLVNRQFFYYRLIGQYIDYLH